MHKRANKNAGARSRRSRFPKTDRVLELFGRLADDDTRLRTMLGRLKALVNSVDRGGRMTPATDPADLRSYLTSDLATRLRDEAVILRCLSRKRGLSGAAQITLSELKKEHVALHWLLHPVVSGLGEIAEEGAPASPANFVRSALVLNEFLQMHMDYKEEALIPLASAVLTMEDLAELDRAPAAAKAAPWTMASGGSAFDPSRGAYCH